MAKKLLMVMPLLLCSVYICAASDPELDALLSKTKAAAAELGVTDADIENAQKMIENEMSKQEDGADGGENSESSSSANESSSVQSSDSCFSNLAGSWRHPQGGIWTFNGATGKIVLNSTNFGDAAQQITELNISSCNNNTLVYTLTRAALVNTVDPTFAYDKTKESAPSDFDWTKVYNQPYQLSSQGLQLGKFTYIKQ